MYTKQRFDLGFSGNAYFVSDSQGNDANIGTCWDKPFKTINAAHTAVTSGNGDVIYVETGTYDQVALGQFGLQITKDALTLLFIGQGSIIKNTDVTNSGTAVKITGDRVVIRNCLIQKGEVASDNSISLLHDGAIRGTLYDVTIMCEAKANHTGWKLTGGAYAVIMKDGGSGRSAIGGSNLGLGLNLDHAHWCVISNTKLGSTTTGVLFGAASSGNVLDIFSTVDKCSIGIQLDAGAAENYMDCSVLGCATPYIDNSGVTTNIKDGSLTYLRTSINSVIPSASHVEMVYPASAGEGVAGDPVAVTCLISDETHGAVDTKNYWGAPKIIIPRSFVTTQWNWHGMNMVIDTASKVMQYVCYKISNVYSAKNGGNAWDQAATALTVADGTKFLNGDLVWIVSTYKPDGEIVRVNGAPAANVVTIARETSQCACAGLRWNHTTNAAGTEVMYLIRRSTSPYTYERMQGDTEVASSRDHLETRFHTPRLMEANTGILMRCLNATDDTSVTINARAVYEPAYWVTS
jgi:hypothetical protein